MSDYPAQTWRWLTDPVNWRGDFGIPAQTLAHLGYSLLALVLAALIAVPLGLWVGHTGKGRWLAVNITGAFRAIPSLGVLFIAVLLLLPRLQGEAAFVAPTLIVLVLLAIPPILSGTYAGVEAVEPATRDAARGIGMTGREVLTQVELPIALPLVLSGVRAAVLQVVATATIAAYVGLGGLGRFLIDGLATQDYASTAGGAILVALLALGLDAPFALLARLLVSPGLTGRTPRSQRRDARCIDTDPTPAGGTP